MGRNAIIGHTYSYPNCSTDVVSFAREKGYFNGVNKDFSFSLAYAPLDFGARRFCEARVWSYFNKFTDNGKDYLLAGKRNDIRRVHAVFLVVHIKLVDT